MAHRASARRPAVRRGRPARLGRPLGGGLRHGARWRRPPRALATVPSRSPAIRSRITIIHSARAIPVSSPAPRNSSRLSSNSRTAASKSPRAPRMNPWLYSASAMPAGSPSRLDGQGLLVEHLGRRHVLLPPGDAPAPVSALARAGVGPCPEGMARTSSSQRRPSARCPRCCQNRHSAPAASWARWTKPASMAHRRATRMLAWSRSHRSSHSPWSPAVRWGSASTARSRKWSRGAGGRRRSRRWPGAALPELADGLQHGEPGLGVGGLGPADQRLVN